MVLRRALPLSSCALLAILLTGCGSSPNTPHPTPVDSSRSSGSVHGGQQPVVGATIQLYTVGTTADGSAATPLLTSAVTSDSSGSFTITGLYSCTNATQVYIVATGGNPGLSTTNPNIALMAALGPCSSLTSSTFVDINELTTVAAISALAPFMTSATAIGSSSSDAATLANAFTLANQYVNTTTGTAPGANVPSGVTVPTTELNTLADILSACINSTGGTAGDGSLCGQLFSLTTVAPGAAPTNTIQAMLNLAYNPTLSTSALYALTPPTPPFQPTLTSSPANFLVSLQSASSMQVTMPAINFLNVGVGSISPNYTITIQNFNGVSSVGLVGPNASDFTVGILSPPPTGGCGYQSNYPSPCWTQVEVRPSAAGVRNAAIVISYNYGTSSFFVPLSATGIASAPNSPLSTSFINFPPTIAGTSSTPVAVTLSNTGTGAITVSPITITGVANNNFTQTNNCSNVAPNANCTIYVTFAPTASGVQSATLQITDTATGSSTVALSGTGASPSDPASLWPGSLTFTIWGAYEDMVLTNSTTGLGVGTTGGLGQDHGYSVNGCSPISATSCANSIANVAVHPLSFYSNFGSATGNAFVNNTSLTAELLSQSSSYLSQSTGGVNGNGINGTVTFPSQQMGQSVTATIQLANVPPPAGSPNQNGTGSPAASLAIYGANPGDFSVSAVQPTVSSTPSSFCPAASTGTQPCTITVTFTPTAAGTRTAKISLDANGSSTGQYFSVTGTGVGPGPSFRFNGVQVISHLPAGIDPASTGNGPIVVTNTGTTTLSLSASLTGANPSAFAVDTSRCQSVAPQATCSVPVTITAGVGNYSATLALTDVSSGTAVSSGIGGSLSYWSPTVFSASSVVGPPPFPITFPSQAVNTTSAPQTFTVADPNQYPIGDPITVSLAANSNFILSNGSTCPTGNQPCTLSIEFAPHTTGGIYETLTLTDPTTGVTTTATIYGTGTQ